ncbi:MarR family winged helix-turn-helix transcriptional regulator [Alicyclobacillus acidocaldarius]|uniref:MarR family winged helix-turn-helix transcriptional regulator n=1 Tax=Alicyclobacillus acidocaldarius TaxID=405212 RepID=UPI00345E1A79
MTERPLLSLDEHLCFAVYACARETMRLYRSFLEPHGLTFPQYMVLVALYELGACTVKALGERLYLDSGTLTPLLKRMQESGLVDRRRDTDDERKMCVSLTEKGRALREELGTVPDCVKDQIDDLQDEDIADLRARVRALLERIHRANEQLSGE